VTAIATAAPQAASPRRANPFAGYSPVVLILIALMLGVMLPPIVFLIKSSLYTTNPDGSFRDFTWRYYANLIESPQFARHLLNTAIYAFGSAVVALLLGGLQAWIVERTNTPLRRYVFVVSIFSLGIPSVLYTVAFLLLLGRMGPVNQLISSVFGIGQAVNVYSMWGMIIIEGIDFAPLVFLLLTAVFRGIDASFEEASMMSGATVATTLRKITLRLATPALAALLILIFVRAFESFETPALVGRPGGVYVLTTDIYTSTRVERPPSYGQAAAFALVLMGIVAGLLYFYNRLSRRAERYQTITGKGYRPRVTDLGRWRYLTAAILVLLFAIVIVLPIGIVVWAAFLPFYQPFSMAGLGRLTLDNFREILDNDAIYDSGVNTLILGAGTATAVSLITAVFAWLAVRRYRGAWILDQLATLPLVFPAIVLGVALLQVFLSVPVLYGTLISLIIASWIRYMPYGMRYSYVGALQIHRELEEASALSGARMRTTFMRIVLPLLLPALVTCWLFVFLSATKALSLLVLLVGPRTSVIAVTIFDLWENGSLPELAALGVAWTSLMTVVSAIFYFFARRYGLSER
jgi:iron(III) transport system permease protein